MGKDLTKALICRLLLLESLLDESSLVTSSANMSGEDFWF